MRILHYLPSMDPERGGPVRAVLDLSHALVARGHRVTIASSELDPRSTTQPGGPALLHLPGKAVVVGPITRPQVEHAARLIAEHDVLHVHGAWTYSNIQVANAARRLKKPYLLSPRGMLDDWCMEQKRLKKLAYYWAVGKRHFERAAFVHCTAQAELDQSRKWFPRGQGVVLPNLLDLNPFRNAPGPGLAREKFPFLSGARPNVLFLSRLHYKKGAEIFLDAAGIVTSRGIDAGWVLAGTGDGPYVEELRRRAERLNLSDRILWTGHVGGELKVSLYQACALFALPTSQENFGFVFPESLASGTPVITTKGVDIWPELTRSGAALIVDRTPEAFAQAIAALLTDRPRLAEMAQRGRPFALAEYEETRLVRRYEELYQSALRPVQGR